MLLLPPEHCLSLKVVSLPLGCIWLTSDMERLKVAVLLQVCAGLTLD